MRAEPGYEFPTAEEIIEEVKEFAADRQDQPNIIKIITKLFPALD